MDLHSKFQPASIAALISSAGLGNGTRHYDGRPKAGGVPGRCFSGRQGCEAQPILQRCCGPSAEVLNRDLKCRVIAESSGLGDDRHVRQDSAAQQSPR